MWKKPENENPQPEPHVIQARSNPVEPRKNEALIGPSISIKGELTGEEDLVIQGRFEGKMDLKQNNVTVGEKGRVKADIHGRVINIEGEVEGNLYGAEQILIRKSGAVRGNITSTRVSLEDGSKFKGSIDMDAKGTEKHRASGAGGNEPRSRADIMQTSDTGQISKVVTKEA